MAGAFEFHHASIPVNGKAPFTFAQKVQQIVMGISGFRLEFAKKDHYVKNMSISLSPKKLSGAQIEVTANATLDDDSGHQIDAASRVNVSILAWVDNDGDHDDLTLINLPLIRTGVNTSGQLNAGRPVFLQTVLAGFNFSYSNDDHALQQVSIAVGSNIRGKTFTPIVNAAMIGHHSSVATCFGDCGLIALSESNSHLRATSYNLGQGKACPFASNASDTSGKNYVAFMTGFNLRYTSGEDHAIKAIFAGISLKDENGEATAEVGMHKDGKNQALTAWVAGVTFGYPVLPKVTPAKN